MIPNPNSNPIIPPSPRRHAHYAVPFEKIQIHQNFLTIKSIPSAIYPPFDLRETSEDKPFIRIVNKETDSSNDTTICLERPRMMIRKNSLVERREIVIPNNTNMPRVHTRVDSIEERPHKKLHTDLSYIKVDHNRSFPTADVYEPSDNDLKFLFELNQKIFNGSENSSNTPKITEEIFESLIIAWENETAENDIISLDHALQVVESSSCLKNKFLMDEINPIRTELLSHIYNHWRDLRDQYKRPLLRKFLKATNKDFSNPNIAFLRRKENKFARRRSQRTSSPVDDFKRMKNLKKTIERSSLMLANLKYREMIKLEMHEIKNKFFEEQVKQLLGDDYKQFEELYPRMPSITCSDTYKEDRKKMEEYGKKGEIIVRGVNSMRKDSFKADISIEAKRKLSSNMQPSTSSISTTASTTTTPHHTYKPMSLGLSKMTHALPKNIQGAFTLSIKKSSIDLKDLKTKLKQSLGGLYLKSQDESRVKVEFGSAGCCKIEEEFGNKENHSGNVQKKAVQESREELIIRVDLEEHVQKVEGQKPSYQTTVRYSIHFSENATSPYSQTFALESAKSQKQPSENSKSQLIPHNSKIKS